MIIDKIEQSFFTSTRWTGLPCTSITSSLTNRITKTSPESSSQSALTPKAIHETLEQILISAKSPFNNLWFHGGEPLLQIESFKNLIEQLPKKKAPIYLETNGSLPNYLKEIMEHIHGLSVTIFPEFSSESIETIQAWLYSKKGINNLSINIPIKKGFIAQDLSATFQWIQSIDPNIFVCLVPTPNFIRKETATPKKDILRALALSKKYLKTIKVTPDINHILK
ncbi:hypothetical protein HOG98_01285 [bacterium]|jgi:7-carboxy-7-deazaguanine synthase|nr:hypothetical protein [bacterium]